MRRRYFTFVTFLLISMAVIVTPQTRRNRSARRVVGNDVEAAKQNVWKAFNARATKCGESYFASGGGRLLEMKSCSPVLRMVRQNTDADRLNGILWSGQIDIQCSAWREYPNGRWYDWDYFIMSKGYFLSFNVWKSRNGFHNQKINPEYLVKAACSSNGRGGQAAKRYGLELDDYCERKYGSPDAVPTAGNAYGWRCRVAGSNGGGQYFEMDMDEACRMQHGNQFRAIADNPRDIRSWHCIPK